MPARFGARAAPGAVTSRLHVHPVIAVVLLGVFQAIAYARAHL